MRSPLRTNPSRIQQAAVNSFPSPTAGWNARDALADMKPNEAVALQNWFPKPAYCESRGGWESHATGMTGNGKTLAVYNAMTGTSKMFCATNSGIYDVSSAGAVGASVLARTNGKHQCFNYGDGTNNWLVMLNGVDAPAYYDGTTWTAVTGVTSPALTGITATELISGFVFKGRVIFIPKESLSFWYLSAGVVGGALTEFDLSAEFDKGGYLMAGISWTRDGGSGMDDFAVFISSEGQVAVYQGTNPSSAANWAKVGMFNLARPLGRRCLSKYGGDVLALTEEGAYPLSLALPAGETEKSKYALSYKIEPEFADAARSTVSTFGWEATVFPSRTALIINVPEAEDGTHEQYVMNTITKSWCKFTDWNAETFCVFAGSLYFAQGTAVKKAWTGTSDGGSNIILYAKEAFKYLAGRGQLMHVDMFRPVLAVNGTVSFLTDIDVDFKDTEISGTATYTVVSGAIWDSANWDEAYWAAGLEVLREWTSPDEHTGYCAAGKIKIATNSLTIQWMSSDYLWKRGGPI